jgi:hypothetical protein
MIATVSWFQSPTGTMIRLKVEGPGTSYRKTIKSKKAALAMASKLGASEIIDLAI